MCVTRTRGKTLRSEGSGAFDESIQRTPRGVKQQGEIDLTPRLRIPLSRRADRNDLPLLRRHPDRSPSPMSHPQTERRAANYATASAPRQLVTNAASQGGSTTAHFRDWCRLQSDGVREGTLAGRAGNSAYQDVTRCCLPIIVSGLLRL